MTEIARIAEAYKKEKDQLELIPDLDRIKHAFRKVINKQFSELSKRVYFDFVDYEPYEYTTIDDMWKDYVDGTIKVNTTGNNSNFWGTFHNLQFRAIHDYIHCEYALHFNYEAEVEAFHAQTDFTMSTTYHIPELKNEDWAVYSRILRSEIVYQAAVKTHFQEFHLPEQKIILTDL